MLRDWLFSRCSQRQRWPLPALRRRPGSSSIVRIAIALLCGFSIFAQGQTDPLEQGVAAMQRGDFPAAENAFRAATQANPRNARAWKALGVSFAARGQHDLASQPFSKACALDRNEPDACYYLARNHYLLNRFDEALKLFDTLANQQKADWRYSNGRGLALMALARYPEAESAFKASMANERGASAPDEAPAVNLGSLYSRAGEPHKALEVLQAFVSSRKPGARAWFEKAKVEVQLGKIEDAAASLTSAIQVNPSHREAHLLLAKVYGRLGDPAKAADHRRRGLQIAP
jgi:Flp pilus assembly protein TadD